MLALAARCGVKNIIVHPILDGRDVAPKSATTFLGRLEQQLQAVGVGVIGSLQGRFYAMDRDQNLDRTAAAYEMLCGQRLVATGSWAAYLDQSYQTGNSDEFVVPTLLDKRFALCDGDAMVFVNVRPDRAKQLTTCLLGQTPAGSLKKLAWVLTGYQYDAALHNPVIIKPINVSDTFLDVVAAARPAWPHFLIAETEKYAHVTYFFKGMRDEHPSYETRILIPSLKVRDYVGHPAMSAFAITQQVINTLTHHPGALCIVNYANADMVGHSGNLAAATAACSIVDKQLAQLYDLVVQRLHGTLIVTADHGNAEAMLDVHDQIVTAHTTNPVPFVIAQQSLHHAAIPHNQSAGRGIAHVAPTVLKHLGIAVPTVMTEPLF
jgi:2,3-bisphosphoglycerate-independent phosphoglycerate mutase